jgi:hypothetical protein
MAVRARRNVLLKNYQTQKVIQNNSIERRYCLAMKLLPHFLRHVLFTVVFLVVPMAEACERIPLSTPVRLQTLADRQPTLSWPGQSEQRYRLQVAALLPEARVVALHDMEVTGTHWRLPEPLPLARASLKVVVSKNCPRLDTQDLLAQGPWFFVDVRPGCAIDPASLQAAAAGLRWAPVANAQRYSVRAFDQRAFASGETLTPLSETEVREPQWFWDESQRERKQVLTIQAACDGQWGRPVAWPVAKP